MTRPSTPEPDRDDARRAGRKEGERRRDAGIHRAEHKKQSRDPAGQLRAEARWLETLLAKGRASGDDAVSDLDAKHDDGGHWLGGIILRLSKQRLIVDVGSVRSCRPVRHRGRQTLWGIAEGKREALESRLRDVLLMLNALTSNDGGSATSAEPPADFQN